MQSDGPGDQAAGGTPEGGRGRLLGALGVGLVLGGALLWLFYRDHRPPQLPADLVHSASMGSAVPAACMNCHASDGPRPRPASHTGRQDCANCHFLP